MTTLETMPSSTTLDTAVPVPVRVARPDDDLVPATIVTPRMTPTLTHRMRWERHYRNRLRLTDAAIVVFVTLLTGYLQLLVAAPSVLAHDPWAVVRVPAVTALFWLASLAVVRTSTSDIIGSGVTEYKRIVHATSMAFGLLAISFVLFQMQGLRMQLMVGLPVGLFGLLAGRWCWRRWLIRQRGTGLYSSRTLVVGTRDDVEYVAETIKKDPRLGYELVGMTLFSVDDHPSMEVGGNSYPVVGTSNTIAQAAQMLSADTIIVASRPAGDPEFTKRLAWQLEGTAADLVISSRLADVAGPRMSFRQVEGLPLIHVRIPTFEGERHAVKRAFDVIAAGAALLAFAPFGLLVAAAIWLDSRGPVFFRQKRVGQDGREFTMFKFRSMKTTAEQDLAALLADNEGAGPLFKMKSDPRVTRVGRVLRKFSLDEVPQFLNVLIGDMSIVGPRPPLPSEVRAYDGTVFRRLYIKPGITGLWQVSGRSDLSWEESVRLDLRYVENWSLLADLKIMWRTVDVMLRPKGAY